MIVRLRMTCGIAVATAVLVLPTGATGLGAAPVSSDAGDVAVVAPTNVSDEIESGQGDTPFALRLPADASCPGDSANDDWRVDSFLVPASVDPATLQFNGAGPIGAGQLPLYQLSTFPFAATFTEPNEVPGDPGKIPPSPVLTFSVWAPDAVEIIGEGTYAIGIACTFWGRVGPYWDTLIDIEADPTDQVARMRWRPEASRAAAPVDAASTERSPTDERSSTDEGSSSWLLAALVAVVVAVVAGVLVVQHRRRSTSLVKGTS